MAKDAKGHGSEKRGGASPVQSENAPFKSRLGPLAGDLRTNPSGPHVAAGVDKSGRTVPVTVSDADAAKALAGGGAKSAAVPVHSGAAGRSPLDASGMSLDRPAAGQRNAQGYRTQGTAYEGPRYNRDAVNNAIASSNRSGRKIGGREASLIHRLLKGRQVGDQ